MMTGIDEILEKEKGKMKKIDEKHKAIVSSYFKVKEELPDAKKWTIFRLVGESIGISTTYVNQVLKKKGVV